MRTRLQGSCRNIHCARSDFFLGQIERAPRRPCRGQMQIFAYRARLLASLQRLSRAGQQSSAKAARQKPSSEVVVANGGQQIAASVFLARPPRMEKTWTLAVLQKSGALFSSHTIDSRSRRPQLRPRSPLPPSPPPPWSSSSFVVSAIFLHPVCRHRRHT